MRSRRQSSGRCLEAQPCISPVGSPLDCWAPGSSAGSYRDCSSRSSRTISAIYPGVSATLIAAGWPPHTSPPGEPRASIRWSRCVWNSRRPALTCRCRAGSSDPASGGQWLRNSRRSASLKTAFGTDILFSAREAEQQGTDTGRAHTMVHARRSADHGDINKRRIACSVRSSQSISRQARRRWRAHMPIFLWWMATLRGPRSR